MSLHHDDGDDDDGGGGCDDGNDLRGKRIVIQIMQINYYNRDSKIQLCKLQAQNLTWMVILVQEARVGINLHEKGRAQVTEVLDRETHFLCHAM